MQDSTSDLLRDNCDEFIYYEDLGKAPIDAAGARPPAARDEAEGVRAAARLAAGPAAREQGGALVVDGQGHDEAEEAVVQRGRTTATARSASCSKTRSSKGLLELDTDKRSRTYVVTRFGDELQQPPPELPLAAPAKSRRRRRGRRRTGEPNGHLEAPPAPAPRPSIHQTELVWGARKREQGTSEWPPSTR